jgi:hypothetical protein
MMLAVLVVKFFLQVIYRFFVNPYVNCTSEFLINYQGGFVRRGLPGQILFLLSENFSIDVFLAIRIFTLICMLLVCTFFVVSFKKGNYALYILPCCFFLGAHLMISGLWMNKDYFMICTLIAIFWIHNRTKWRYGIQLLLINLLGIIVLLSHESFAFFALPVLFLLVLHRYKDKTRSVFRAASFATLSLLPCIGVFLTVCMFHGAPGTCDIILNSWNLPDINRILPVAVQWIDVDALSAIKMVLNWNFLTVEDRVIAGSIWLITFPVVYYILTQFLLVFRKHPNSFTVKQQTQLSAVILFQAICLAPAFIFLFRDTLRVYCFWSLSSYAIYLLTSSDTLDKIFPAKYQNIAEKINVRFSQILPPSKTIMVILMMTVGINLISFSIRETYWTSLLYQLLSFFYLVVRGFKEFAIFFF